MDWSVARRWRLRLDRFECSSGNVACSPKEADATSVQEGKGRGCERSSACALVYTFYVIPSRALSLSLGGYLFFIGCPGNRIPSDINHLYRGFLICVHFFLLVFHPSRTRLSFSFFSCLYALFDICPAFDARGFLLLPSPPSLALPQSRFTSSSSYLSRFPRRRYIYIHAYV